MKEPMELYSRGIIVIREIMKKIAIITTTRAEYGLLQPLISELRKREDKFFKVEFVVTGTHLIREYGSTADEIKERIDYKIPISVNSDTDNSIAKNQADALIKFTELFSERKYEAVILLGDRYETLSIAIAAGNTRTPIFHMCGGDTTEGAMDEWIRHSITKMSYLHFVTNEESKRRVIQLGENPNRVFNYGSTSIDNIIYASDMNKTEALESIGLSECKYALCTYHPVTMDDRNVDEYVLDFLEAVKAFPEIEFVTTKSNADKGGARINKMLDNAEKEIKNIHVYASLGTRRYLSLMKHAEFVLGNSSSGIIEAPMFHIPTVNIGKRQSGRLKAESVISCGMMKEDIIAAIKKVLGAEHRELCKKVKSLYGEGNAAQSIAEKAYETVMRGRIDLRKQFYNL